MTTVDLDVQWIHGADSDPALQTHLAAPGTWILRQSKKLNYEGPFLYLLAGSTRALLVDTGATADPALFPLRRTVDELIGPDFPLVVGHSHAHGDHIAADAQFAGRPNTIVVGHSAADVGGFFGITDWPAQQASFDLGGRVLAVAGIPGHQDASIAIYDTDTGLLLTGDTVYPGRLYVQDMAAFIQSLDRLVAFTHAHEVTHVLGCHIEMTALPGRDYPLGSTFQPDEAPLAMTAGQLVEVRDCARSVSGRPGAHQFNDFAIFNGPCRAAVARQWARLLTASAMRAIQRRT
ncbi:MAG: MBL fold metallo-hydrolase [Dermatophilaceae bacterium]